MFKPGVTALPYIGFIFATDGGREAIEATAGMLGVTIDLAIPVPNIAGITGAIGATTGATCPAGTILCLNKK
jgi:activator of 2-hydroxyglutaryl-CoA dehydratase